MRANIFVKNVSAWDQLFLIMSIRESLPLSSLNWKLSLLPTAGISDDRIYPELTRPPLSGIFTLFTVYILCYPIEVHAAESPKSTVT
jgi:hypothetical protein